MIPRVRLTSTTPIVEPVTLADVKAHLVIGDSTDDTLLTSFITVAREACEDITGRAIPLQSQIVTLDRWPHNGAEEWWDGVRDGVMSFYGRGAYIEIPRPPLVSVESITVYDDTDTPAVWASSNYYVDASDTNHPGRVCVRAQSVPPIGLRTRAAVEIACTVGYATVPASLCRAIMMMVADLYSNRGDGWSASIKMGTGATADTANRSGAMSLLERYILRNI